MDTCLLNRSTYGILTDVTYRFFKTGFLLSSSVYCDKLQQWVPVLFTYIEDQKTESHSVHFRVLIKYVIKNIKVRDDQLLTLAQVVDYSAAQKISMYPKLRF